MMISTVTLTGPALDWAVAKASHNLHPVGDVRLLDGKLFTIEPGDYDRSDAWRIFSPSTEWSQAGPIIEQELIGTDFRGWGMWESWDDKTMPAQRYSGPTPLIAAMRCYVASNLGDTVDVSKRCLSA